MSPRAARLLLLAAAALAIFFWRGGLGLFPVDRTLTWRLWGDYAAIRRVELELRGGGELLERSELSTPTGVSFEPVSKVPLKAGTYEATIAVWRADAGAPEVRRGTLRADPQEVDLVVVTDAAAPAR